MKSSSAPPQRRRQGVLLQRLEDRVLFDAAGAMPPDPSQVPTPLNSPLTVADVALQVNGNPSANNGGSTQSGALANSAGSLVQQVSAAGFVTPQAPLSNQVALAASGNNIGVSTAIEGVVQSRQLAFPGAAGFGAYAQGGRGGDVYHVTNLRDSGSGSLRDAIQTATGPRTVVFDVSGTIDLESRLIIDKPYITLAGQTAPGDGITLRNYGTAVMDTHDVVIQYMRFRSGDPVVGEHDTLLVFRSNDIMIDHVSASWGVDETLPIADSNNVTVQWSIVSEGLYNSHHHKGDHSAGMLEYGGNVTLHHNLFAHHDIRSPLVRQDVDVVNNVIYNWGDFATMVGYSNSLTDPFGPTRVNLQNNYYLAGPSTSQPHRFYLGYEGSEVWLSGNILDSNRNNVPDGQLGTVLHGYSTQVGSRFDYPVVPTDDAFTAYQLVLREAGASLSRDAVDQRVVDDVINETGHIIDSQGEVGGWPTLTSKPAPLDSDRDGMPDHWENSLSHLNPLDPSDRNSAFDASGITNLEHYLSAIASAGPQFTVNGPRQVEAGEQFSLQLVSLNPTNGGNTTYLVEIDWDGNGQPDESLNAALGITVDHVFGQPGTFPVHVTLTDGQGRSTTATHDVQVAPVVPAPQFRIQGPRQAEEGEALVFTLAPSPGFSVTAASYTFDIDWNGDQQDDQTVTGPLGTQVQHTFGQPGTYTIHVTLTDDRDNTTTATHNVQVTAVVPAPQFQIQGPQQAEVDEALAFTFAPAPGSNATATPYTFAIDWNGDQRNDQTVTGPLGSQVQHTFGQSGTYPIHVTLTDDRGQSTTATFDVQVTAVVPAPQFQILGPQQAEVGEALAFTFAPAPGSSAAATPYTFAIDWNGDQRNDQTVTGPLGSQVQRTFGQPGTYPIHVTLTDDRGQSTTATLDVQVAAVVPAPRFQVLGPQQAEVGEALVFTFASAAGSSATGTSYTFAIDWNGDQQDDQTVTGPLNSQVQHTFGQPGTYPIHVTLTDDRGQSTTASFDVQVTAVVPAPQFQIQGSQQAEVGEALAFTFAPAPGNNATSTSYTFAIDWNGDQQDDQTVTGPLNSQVQHTFGQPGTYPIHVTLTDDRGQSTTASFDVQVTAVVPAPQFQIQGPQRAEVGEALAFTFAPPPGSSATLTPYTFAIDWNGDQQDDQTVTGPLNSQVQHTFGQPGTYPIHVTLTDDRGQIATATLDVQVTAVVPAPQFQIQGPQQAEVGEALVFTFAPAPGSNATLTSYTFAIDWNGDQQDDQTVTGPLGTQVQRTFGQPGSFPIHVTLTDDRGRSTTATHDVQVTAVVPAPQFQILGPQRAEVGEALAFTFAPPPGSSATLTPYTFAIDWNGDQQDDQTFTGPLDSQVQHTFGQPGTYPIHVALTDDRGQIATATLDVQVTAVVPAPQFQILGPQQAEVGEALVFTFAPAPGSNATSTSYTFAIDWNGDQQDDQTVTGPLGIQVQHAYGQPGTYPVHVTLTDDRGRSSTAIHDVQIAAAVATSQFKVQGPTQAGAGEALRFTLEPADPSAPDVSRYAILIDWNGDGQTEQAFFGRLSIHVIKVFPQPGSYSINFTLVDENGDRSSVSHELDVMPAVVIPQFQIDGPVQGDVGAALTFTLTPAGGIGNNSATVYTFSIDWNGDDESDQVVTGPWGTQFSHAFDQPGVYDVRVSIVDQVGKVQQVASKRIGIAVVATPGEGNVAVGGTQPSTPQLIETFSPLVSRTIQENLLSKPSPIGVPLSSADQSDRFDSDALDAETRQFTQLFSTLSQRVEESNGPPVNTSESPQNYSARPVTSDDSLAETWNANRSDSPDDASQWTMEIATVAADVDQHAAVFDVTDVVASHQFDPTLEPPHDEAVDQDGEEREPRESDSSDEGQQNPRATPKELSESEELPREAKDSRSTNKDRVPPEKSNGRGSPPPKESDRSQEENSVSESD